MKWKKYLFPVVLLCLAILLTACSGAGTAATTEQKDGNQTITVIDYLGREVTIPKQVNRIATLYAYTGHVVTMLGEGEKIVAVNSGLQRDNLLVEMNPAIEKAAVPTRNGKLNIEELAASNPDLIFIQKSTARDQGETRKLDELKIPYLAVDFNSIKEQQQSIEMIGKAIGQAKKAKQYNEFYNKVIAEVSEKVKDIPEKDRVRVYHSVNEATRTDIADSLSAEWIKTTGAINVSTGENLKLIENKSFASLEQILLWEPDVIIVNEAGVDDYILNSPQWQTLKSVKNKQVYLLPNGVSRWGHPGALETPLAILWTAKTLYPDRFKEINLEEVTTKFYQDFFNFKLTPEITEKILSGKGMRIPKGNE
ncbi:ABC transporter substrate-binding protein [Neobacillus niacini]|uniref:ABC transporter substrate-binding protein n=1 Tax=Neobacillus niacini TaxID=86668 RepID=UPI0021CB4072|nr:ABC transporter substrate-binding protein [Neobacillus niacini]MCM3763674.1 ABC transporter substrate-binding protein [Neobacillus niacini]